MGDNFDSLITRNVNNIPPIPARYDQQQYQKRKQNEKRQDTPRESKDFLRTLQKAAEASNVTLQKRNAPYRFRVYERNGEVFVELVMYDENGNIREEKVRRITHESFEKWVEDLSRMEGLYLDTEG